MVSMYCGCEWPAITCIGGFIFLLLWIFPSCVFFKRIYPFLFVCLVFTLFILYVFMLGQQYMKGVYLIIDHTCMLFSWNVPVLLFQNLKKKVKKRETQRKTNIHKVNISIFRFQCKLGWGYLRRGSTQQQK